MTLNVTVLTPTIIYQSADFRLTDFGNGKFITDQSPKTVSLIFSSWNGFVTYTGVGRWRERDISDQVADWLTGTPNLSMDEVARIIESRGTALLRDREQFYERSRHTFTLAGFEEGRARVYVISNFEDCFGASRSTADDHLSTTTRALGVCRKATVIVTGRKSAVPRPDRRTLGNLAARYPGDGVRIRRRMVALNATAAASPRSGGAASRECIVLSFTADGRGVMQLSTDGSEKPAQFPTVMNGVNVKTMIMDALKGLGVDTSKVRVVQGASTSLRAGNRSKVTGPCQYSVAVPDTTYGYGLTEITSSEFEPAVARDISDSSEIVGTGRSGPGIYPNIPWSWRDGQIRRLNYAGLAAAVNGAGSVVAVLQSAGRQLAALYEEDTLIELPLYHGEPGVFAGSDSEASAISIQGTIAGSVRSQSEERDFPNIRASVFRVGSPTVILEGVPSEYRCRALDINSRDHVLVVSNPGPFDSRCILWDLSAGTCSPIGDDTHNVFPTAITDDDVVLGQARNAQNEPVAVICRPGGRWERLGTPDGWRPVDMNSKGEAVGWAIEEHLDAPWLRRPNGEVVMLPHLREHNTVPDAINSAGQIVGHAQADHGSHAVLWHTQ
jgi:hypothetical protein